MVNQIWRHTDLKDNISNIHLVPVLLSTVHHPVIGGGDGGPWGGGKLYEGELYKRSHAREAWESRN